MLDRRLPRRPPRRDAENVTSTHDTPATKATPDATRPSVLPGVALALAVALAAWGVSTLVPSAGALLVAIALGMLLANTTGAPAAAEPGLAVASKRLLRLGIVLLGLQLSLRDIVHLGAGMLLVVVAVVIGGLVTAELAGRALGLRPAQRTLIGAGFSICGAAAVAGVEGVLDDKEHEDVVTAIALVVLFGTAMIPLLPLLGTLLGLDPRTTGLWAGASVHEVAQVVAIGGVLGPTALTAAVVVKLARVLMLAPVMVWFGRPSRRRGPTQGRRGAPLVPLFVVGFLLAAVVRTTGILPGPALEVARIAQTLLLAAAMFALGCGVRVSTLRAAGTRPVALGAITTVVVAGIALGGVLLVA